MSFELYIVQKKGFKLRRGDICNDVEWRDRRKIISTNELVTTFTSWHVKYYLIVLGNCSGYSLAISHSLDIHELYKPFSTNKSFIVDFSSFLHETYEITVLGNQSTTVFYSPLSRIWN